MNFDLIIMLNHKPVLSGVDHSNDLQKLKTGQLDMGDKHQVIINYDKLPW